MGEGKEFKQYCVVCSGELETAYYADYDDFDGRPDWLCSIKTSESGDKILKRCKQCWLLYAK